MRVCLHLLVRALVCCVFVGDCVCLCVCLCVFVFVCLCVFVRSCVVVRLRLWGLFVWICA